MKMNFLVAIPYLKEDIADYLKTIQKDTCVILDSGAFTYWKQNKEMALDEYIKFIESPPIKLWRYFTLDVVGNAKKTNRNLSILNQKGFKPIPIFTRGDDPKLIDKYYEVSDFIGIGGLVGTRGNKGFIKGIMEHVGQRKVHWLGFTQNDFLHHYKPFSCDSSSWSMPIRYGTLDLYLGKGRWKTFKRSDFEKRPSDEITRLFQEYEEDPLGFRFEEQWRTDHNLLAKISFKAWTKYQIEIEKVLNVKFFLSCATLSQFQLLFDSYLFWKNKMSIQEEKPKTIRRSSSKKSCK